MTISKSLSETIRSLKAQAEAARAMGQVRYPLALREEISECVATMRSEGIAWELCKDALGICKATLYAWHRESNEAPTSAKMVPVKIRLEKKTESKTGLQLVTPNGHQLSGFDLAEAAQLLRVLG